MNSYAEIRLVAVLTLATFFLAFSLPWLLRAADFNDDSLDDTWEAQYGFSTGAYAATNLVGWWQFQGTNSSDNASDSSGHGFNGTLSGFPTLAYGPGLFSNALNFTTNAAVTFPTTNSLLNATNQFTFSAWFQATNNLSQPANIANWRDAAANGWSVGVASNGVANVTFYQGGSAQVVTGTTGAANLYDGNWHQVAATYTTNQAATLYVDGTGEATNTITGWAPGSVSSFAFGTTNTGATNNPYSLDDTRLYNRALAASEVVQLPVTYTDWNGTGLSVYQDYLEGLNPLATNSIVTSGFLSSGLTGYYSGALPTLTKSSGGDGQTVAASTFASNPLVVHVTDGSGTALVNAPITFAVAPGSDGGLALTSGGTTTPSLSLTTDSSGNATVYYEAGPEAIQNNTITATAVASAGSASVSFTAYCGVQSGLNLWFRADAGVTQSSGNVSQWNDQSPNAFTATQSTGANQPVLVSNAVNGLPALQFSGSQTLVGTGTVSDTSTQGTTIITVASTTTPGSQEYSVNVGNTAGPGVTRTMGYVYSEQTFAVSYAQAVAGASPPLGTFVADVATLGTDGASTTFYRNGTETGTGSNGGTGTAAAGFTLGSYVGNSYNWTGEIAEVLVYNRVLTSTELEAVDGYLADKYGYYSPNAAWPSAYSSAVQAEITRNQWNKAQADNYVALQADNPSMLTNGLVLWLKADSGVTQTSGSVSAWADQTGNYTATQATTANQPSYVASDLNGKPALRFNGSQWLYNSSNLNLNADMTIIVVGDTTSPGTQQWALWLGAYSGHGRSFGYYGGDQSFSPDDSNAQGEAAPAANTFAAEELSLNSSLNEVSFYRNGTSTATSSISGVYSMGAGITVGNYVGDFLGWQGDIAEELVYDHQLSSTELAQVDGYLADKYGYYSPNATWPLSYDSEVQAEIALHLWNETQAASYAAMESSNPTMLTHGLMLWLKADDGISQDGSGNVNSWADQTGNFPVSQSGGARPTYIANDVNGEPALRFSGSQWLYNSSNIGPDLNADMTMIMVASTTSPATLQENLFLGSGSPYVNRGMGYYLGDELFDGNTDYTLGVAVPGANTFVAEAETLNSGLNTLTFYRNGVQTASSSISGVANITAGITVGATTDQYAPWHGDIAEVLVYDHKLTSTELAQVDCYLADKYGYYSPNATWPSAYDSEVQAEIALHQWTATQASNYAALESSNPTMLTHGLMLWLKADSGVTQDGSGNVNSWTDQTGNYPVSQSGGARPTYVANDVNGLPALRFNGSQYLYNPANIGLNSDLTIIEVGDSTGSNYLEEAVWLGNATAGQARGYGYRSGAEYFDFDDYDWLGAAVPPDGQFATEEMTLDSTLTNLAFYRNGVATSTATVSNSQPLGAGIHIGIWAGGAYGWVGDMSEVLVYDHKLSSTELAEVDGYLADKYGFYDINATWPSSFSSDVQAQITANHWDESQANAYVTFLATAPPVPPTGLVLWLSANTGVTTDGSGNVNSWADQSMTGAVVSQSTSGVKPTLTTNPVNNMPQVSFNGSQRLVAPATTYVPLDGDWTVITYGASNDTGSERYMVSVGDGGITGAQRAIGNLSGDNLAAFWNYATYDGTYLPSGETGIVEAEYTHSSGGLSFYEQGTLSGTVTESLAPTNTGLIVGDITSGFYPRPWLGDSQEILVYNRALSSTERQEVEAFLINKYGVYTSTATWYDSAPYYAILGEITRNQWNRAQADNYLAMQSSNPTMLTDGLLLWLKADAGVTTDGSGNVTSWADQTGNYTVTQTGSARPTYVSSDVNSKPGVRFNGSQSLYSSAALGPGVNQDMTVITVGTTTSPSSTACALYLGQNSSTGANRDYLYEGGNEYFDGDSVGCAGGPAPTASTFTAEITSVNSGLTQTTFYQNGTQTALSTVSGTFANVSSGITVGASGGGSSGWQGDIVEQLVYDHQLSPTEILEVSLYLADKYGLYYDSAPAITPAAGSYSSTQTIGITGTGTTGSIHYTLDGTEPTAASPTYTGSFSLTGSALVSAALFVDGVRTTPIASSQFYINDTGDTGLPTDPTSLSTTVVSGSEVDLGWSFASSLVNYSAVDVYRSADGGTTWQLVAVLPASATAYADTNAVTGTSYEYYVGTLNTSGESNTSDSSPVTPTCATSLSITVTTPSDAVPYP